MPSDLGKQLSKWLSTLTGCSPASSLSVAIMHESAMSTADSPLIDVALLMMVKDKHLKSIDASECYTHVKITELIYALPLVPSVNFNEFPAMKSTPLADLIEPLPTKSHLLLKLEVAANIVCSFGELEPDMLSYNLWLHCDYPVLTSDLVTMHWSSVCQEAIMSELRHMDNISKLKIDGYM